MKKTRLPDGGYKIHLNDKEANVDDVDDILFGRTYYKINQLADKTRYFNVNGNHTAYYNAAGQLHRENGPAVECMNGDKIYCVNGKLHRDDGPAVDTRYQQEYWINGKQVTMADMPNLTLEDLLR